MPITKIVGGIIADGTIASADITDSTITNAKMAVDPSNASNLSSGDVPAAQLDNVPAVNLSPALDDIALLAFKTQVNGNLARYNLVDQFVDAFEDATGVDASASTNELFSSKSWAGGIETLPTGGTTTDYITGGTSYRSHTFLASGNFVTTSAGDVDALIVAGGGGGGRSGGGAGAGGMQAITGIGVTAQTYSIVVGTGGAGNNSDGSQGADGLNSTALSQTASVGGGGGGSYGSDGRNGGSGGGAAVDGSANPAGTGTAGQGYAGGTNFPAGDPYRGGGAGGGAGAVGGAGASAVGGTGGIGLQNAYKTGVNIYYAGGGGGAGTNAGGPGGDGGGGAGKTSGPPKEGDDGTDGLGGGAGAGHDTGGGDGGDGTVIIRYVKADFSSVENMTLVSNSTTAQSAPTKGDLVFTYSNDTGTAVLGTNITADYSADDGSTWTDFGIGASDSQGTTGGHTIVTKNNVTRTSTSGTTMRYRIKTLVQSTALETRIHAVSLGWS